jgi:hypothetical protein
LSDRGWRDPAPRRLVSVGLRAGGSFLLRRSPLVPPLLPLPLRPQFPVPLKAGFVLGGEPRVLTPLRRLPALAARRGLLGCLVRRDRQPPLKVIALGWVEVYERAQPCAPLAAFPLRPDPHGGDHTVGVGRWLNARPSAPPSEVFSGRLRRSGEDRGDGARPAVRVDVDAVVQSHGDRLAEHA